MLQLRVLAPNKMTDEVVRIFDHRRGRDPAATRDRFHLHPGQMVVHPRPKRM
jgi:hypothetical protein